MYPLAKICMNMTPMHKYALIPSRLSYRSFIFSHSFPCNHRPQAAKPGILLAHSLELCFSTSKHHILFRKPSTEHSLMKPVRWPPINVGYSYITPSYWNNKLRSDFFNPILSLFSSSYLRVINPIEKSNICFQYLFQRHILNFSITIVHNPSSSI